MNSRKVTLSPEKFKPVTELVEYIDGVIPAIEKTTQELIKEFGNQNLSLYNYQLKKELKGKKQDLITFCIQANRNHFPAIYLNHSLLVRFGTYLEPFDAGKLVEFIEETYCDIDKIALEQLQFIIIDQMIDHYRCWNWKEKNIEDIKDIYKSGIEFRCHHYHYRPAQMVDAVLKFARISIGYAEGNPIPPSTAEGLKELGIEKIEEGVNYSTDILPSIKLFGNSKLKVRFRSPEEREIFKRSLFMPFWKLLSRKPPMGKLHNYPCSFCMFNGVSCASCEDYSKFKGHCDYCKNKSNLPVGPSTCETCRNGTDSFSPIESVKPALYEIENIKINPPIY